MTVKKVIKPIHGIDLDELDKDLRFLYQNETETVDQFIEAATDLIVSYLNDGMEHYQEYLMEELPMYFKGEIAGVILRARRKTIVENKNDDSSASGW